MTFEAVDLFAGPGGWDVAARNLGFRVLGFESDPATIRTRQAAGLHTVPGDVRNYGASPGRRGLIGSPPCPTWSTASNLYTTSALELVLECIARGRWEPRTPWADARTGLVLEPLRWAIEALWKGYPYRWIALEQVPSVLPVWKAYAETLRAEGYYCAFGTVHAEQFGVPQTRHRAVFLAHLERAVSLPTPTHSRFWKGQPWRTDPGVLPCISLRDVLPERFGLGVQACDSGRISLQSPTSASSGGGKRTAKERGRTTRLGFEPAPTLCSKRMNWITQEEGIWVDELLQVEQSILQGFPADYPWQGKKTEQRQQVGNAVPVQLAEALLRQVCR